MRYVCNRLDLPEKFHIFEEKDGQIWHSSGIVDPSGDDMIMNEPSVVSEKDRDEHVEELKKIGYKLRQPIAPTHMHIRLGSEELQLT